MKIEELLKYINDELSRIYRSAEPRTHPLDMKYRRYYYDDPDCSIGYGFCEITIPPDFGQVRWGGLTVERLVFSGTIPDSGTISDFENIRDTTTYMTVHLSNRAITVECNTASLSDLLKAFQKRSLPYYFTYLYVDMSGWRGFPSDSWDNLNIYTEYVRSTYSVLRASIVSLVLESVNKVAFSRKITAIDVIDLGCAWGQTLRAVVAALQKESYQSIKGFGIDTNTVNINRAKREVEKNDSLTFLVYDVFDIQKLLEEVVYPEGKKEESLTILVSTGGTTVYVLENVDVALKFFQKVSLSPFVDTMFLTGLEPNAVDKYCFDALGWHCDHTEIGVEKHCYSLTKKSDQEAVKYYHDQIHNPRCRGYLNLNFSANPLSIIKNIEEDDKPSITIVNLSFSDFSMPEFGEIFQELSSLENLRLVILNPLHTEGSNEMPEAAIRGLSCYVYVGDLSLLFYMLNCSLQYQPGLPELVYDVLLGETEALSTRSQRFLSAMVELPSLFATAMSKYLDVDNKEQWDLYKWFINFYEGRLFAQSGIYTLEEAPSQLRNTYEERKSKLNENPLVAYQLIIMHILPTKYIRKDTHSSTSSTQKHMFINMVSEDRDLLLDTLDSNYDINPQTRKRLSFFFEQAGEKRRNAPAYIASGTVSKSDEKPQASIR